MKTATELLGIKSIKLLGHGININTIQYHIDKKVKELQKLAASIDAIESNIPDNIDSVYLINRFYLAKSKNDVNSMTRKEVRLLSYLVTSQVSNYKPIISTDSSIDFILDLCENQWSNIVFNSLLSLLFKVWEIPEQQRVEKIRAFVLKKLRLYEGKRKHLVFLKSNPSYIKDRSGPLKIAKTCSTEFDEVSSLTRYMNLNPNWLVYDYFQDAIVLYMEESAKHGKITWQKNLEGLLNLGVSTDVKKRVLARFILSPKIANNERNRRLIRQWAIMFIGKPQSIASWNLSSTRTIPTETLMIEDARRQLLAWITQGIIEFFFEKCINEPRRQKFWLQYATKISDVKVFGTTSTRWMIQQEPRFKDLISDYYVRVNGSGNSAAIVMFINDYVLIEFSDTGNAFFAIKANNFSTNKKVTYIENLKVRNAPMLLKRERRQVSDFHAEGRLFHMDGVLEWEQYFSYWIKRMVGVNV
jgi:hypothetical protein